MTGTAQRVSMRTSVACLAGLWARGVATNTAFTAPGLATSGRRTDAQQHRAQALNSIHLTFAGVLALSHHQFDNYELRVRFPLPPPLTFSMGVWCNGNTLNFYHVMGANRLPFLFLPPRMQLPHRRRQILQPTPSILLGGRRRSVTGERLDHPHVVTILQQLRDHRLTHLQRPQPR